MSHLKLLCLILIFLITLIGGAYPFIKKLLKAEKRDFPYAESLACGIFLGAGLIHMLNDAAHSFSVQGYSYPWAYVLAGTSFLFLLLLEHIGREMSEHHGNSSSGFAILSFLMLSIHSFLTGTGLGLSQPVSVILTLLFAILAHKWAASFALAVHLNRSQLSMKMNLLLFALFALMVPTGIILGDYALQHLQHKALIEPIFNSLAAGTFIYLGTLHGLNYSVLVDKCCDLKRFTLVLLGFSIMALVAIWT